MCQTRCYRKGFCKRSFLLTDLTFWLDSEGKWHDWKELEAEDDEIFGISNFPGHQGLSFFKGDAVFELRDNRWFVREFHNAEYIALLLMNDGKERSWSQIKKEVDSNLGHPFFPASRLRQRRIGLKRNPETWGPGCLWSITDEGRKLLKEIGLRRATII